MAKYSKTLVDKIASLIEEDNYSVASICRIVGIGRNVFYKWRTTKPEFAQALAEAYETREDELRIQARRALQKRIEGYSQVVNRTTFVPSADDPSKMVIKQHVVTEKWCEPDINTILRLIDNGKSPSQIIAAATTKPAVMLTVARNENETRNDLKQVAPATVAEKDKTRATNKDIETPPNEKSATVNQQVSSTLTAQTVNAEDMIAWQKQLKEQLAEQAAPKPSTTTRFVPPPLRGIAYK